jgi:vacuolar iron transporter family protein
VVIGWVQAQGISPGPPPFSRAQALRPDVLPSRPVPHHELHKGQRARWLRAAVLGADDAIVSTASLMIGVAASNSSHQAVLVAGLAGLVAGAASMAAGEYVSVSTQRDAELADIELEKAGLADQPQAELEELILIYEKRGLDHDLARKVAERLSEHDQLEAHLRDELGIDRSNLARPMQAAGASAISFACSALVPILAFLASPAVFGIPVIASVSILSLAGLGALGGSLGGASMGRAALRVTFGGALAMALTAGVGRISEVFLR